VVGLKESYERMISRVQSFGNFIFDLDDTMRDLFKQPLFLEVGAKQARVL
jgi:hypothetical protein